MKDHIVGNKFVEVRVGVENYAIEIDRIKEIIRVPAITAIPASYPYFRGVIQVRNAVLPVYLLSVMLGSQPLAPARSARIVILQLSRSCIGIIVDEVIKVTRPANLLPPPDSSSTAEPGFLSDLYLQEGDMVGILNIDHLVSFLSINL